MRGCARSKLLSRRLVVGRGRSLPSASGRGRSLPSASDADDRSPAPRTRTIPPQRGDDPSLAPPYADDPSSSVLPIFPNCCPSSATTSPAVLQLPKQCYNFPSSTTSQAVLQLPLRWHCPSKPLIVCLIITDSSTAVLSTAFVVTVFSLML